MSDSDRIVVTKAAPVVVVPHTKDTALIQQQVRASIVTNVLQKAGIGLASGLLLSFSLFKRTQSCR